MKPNNKVFGPVASETAEKRGDRTIGDSISRQAAIDALGKDPGFKVRQFGKSYDEGRSDQWFKDVYKLTTVPSAQPEIVKTILEAGYTGQEVRFRIDGRLFAVRELAQ